MNDVAEVVLAQVVLPPDEETCAAGLCGQNACCTVQIRVVADERENEDEEEYWVLPSCQAHALLLMTSVFDHAADKFPPEMVGVPPWEQT